MSITARQYQYLLYLRNRPGKSRTLAALAGYFNVSRSTAFDVVAALEKKELVRKGENEIHLTAAGQKAIAPLWERYEDSVVFLREDMCYTDREAQELALFFLCHVPENLAGVAAGRQIARHAVRRVRLAKHEALSDIPDGVYQTDFTVFQPEKTVTSMGDIGFRKPARLLFFNRCCALELRSRTIRYQNRETGRLIRGQLDRLYFHQAGAWHEVREDSGRWLIPGDAIHLRLGDGGPEGSVRIRARAAACGMPESEADLVLFLKQSDLNELLSSPES
ncbi:MAG: MarR family transcriptional regulator [Oscillospiraceae bacterium]|jgi:DNA-binding MarR family transcriptional regulator|nr:MarR family transcriptional regulator [Oscillospiraceae bacterium]